MEEIHSACQEAVNGLPSRRPIIEMTIPSVLDKTISPPGTQNLSYMIFFFYFMVLYFKRTNMGSKTQIILMKFLVRDLSR